jgi:hypothetical protein
MGLLEWYNSLAAVELPRGSSRVLLERWNGSEAELAILV